MDAEDRIGVTAYIDGMAPFRAAANAYNQTIASMSAATKLGAAGVDALGQVAIGAEREIGRLAVSFVRIANQQLIRFVEGLLSAGAAGTSFISDTKTLKDHLDGIAKVQLAPFFDAFGKLIERASPAIESFTQYALGAFSDLGVRAAGWGENVVNQFAQGMWNAVGSVVDALNSIASMITGFLQPGSPPKLLPDLDDWGKGAMQAYLDGWAKADFGVFNELSGTIETYLKSLSTDSKDTGLIPRILGAREAIAEAVDQARTTGKVTSDSLNQIYTAAGATTQSMQAYVKSVFGLELANAKVAKAQADLNKVTAEYDALLKPVTDKLGQVSEAEKRLGEDSEISQLKLVALDPNATGAEKRQAQLEIERLLTERQQRALVAQKGAAVDAAQAKLDGAVKAQGAAQDEADKQKALMALQTQQNQLLKQQLQLLDSLNKAAAGGGAGPKPSGGGGKQQQPQFRSGFDLSKLIPDDIKKKLADLESTLGATWAAIAAKFQPTVDAIHQKLVPAFENLRQAVAQKMPVIEEEIARTFAFMVDQAAIAAPQMVDNIATGINGIADLVRNHTDTIVHAFGFMLRLAWTVVLLALTDITASFATFFTTVATVLDVGSLIIQGKFDEAWDRLKEGWKTFWGIQLSTADTDLTLLFNLFGLKWSDIKQSAVTFLEGLKTSWSQAWTNIQTALSTTWETIKTNVQDALDSLWGKITARMDEINPQWREDWEKVHTALQEKWDAMVSAIGEKLEAIKAAVATKIGELKAAWSTKWDEIKGVLGTAIDGMKTALNNQLEPFKNIGGALVDGIKAGINGAIAGLVDAAAHAALAALQAAKDALGIHSPSSVAAETIGKPFAEGIAHGIRGNLGAVQAAAWAASLALTHGLAAPALGAGMALVSSAPAVSSGGSSYTDARQFNLGGVNTQRQSDSIIQDFAVLQILAGAPA